MGYNTVGLFLNDNIGDMRVNAQQAVDHIYQRALGNDRDYGPFGMEILPPAHADVIQIIVAGSNDIKVIARVDWWKQDIETIIKAIAKEHGYKIAIRGRPNDNRS